MDNIIHPFQIPIYQSFIDENLFNSLRKILKDYINNNFNVFKTSWGCPTLSNIDALPEKKFYNTKVSNEILKHSKKYLDTWSISSSREIILKELWVNIAKPSHYQDDHHHGNILFSGTIYMNVNEKSGDFILQNPLMTESIIMEYPSILPQSYAIQPKNGMIILFPSWLIHKVTPNFSLHDRISISFNITSNPN